MIPVSLEPEPPDFGQKVRLKGQAWLAAKGIASAGPLPSGVDPSPYWRDCLPDLYRAYRRICAYVAVDIPQVTGAGSADHFVAKSRDAAQIYEWANYRLACSKMNSRKRDFSDVLDPFTVAEGTFQLDLATGAIRPSPALDQLDFDVAQATIDRLDLDDQECRDLRTSWLQELIDGHIDKDYLRRKCPFVFREAVRQNVLAP